MSINLTKRTAESSGSLESNTLTNTGNAKIAHAIFTGMVKDKIGYPIRELCKNAWEVSPKGKPFLVTLPTTWEQIFKVRDFGPGLSHKFMMTKFPKLGYSTKDKGGTEVNGVSGWGFGSKSGFAYLMEDGLTGTFTVISRHKEKDTGTIWERHYSIMIGKKGQPEVHLMMEFEADPSTESGLEVSFPVRARDIDDFQERAEQILWSFEPKPIVTPEIDFGEPKIVQKGKGWTLYDSSSVSWSGPQVRVGPVMYPIDLNEIKHSGFVQPSDDIIFDVDKRKVMATASREALQYTTGSKEAIAKMFAEYQEDYAKVVRAKVDKAKTYFEAAVVFEEETAGLDRERRNVLRNSITWEGRYLHPVVPYKTMLLGDNWSLFDQFKKHAVNTVDIGRAKIAVEHTPYRTADRLEAANLKGEKTLLVRVKRKEFEEFLARFGLRNDQVVVLDNYRLTTNGQRVGNAKNRLRMRKVAHFTINRKIIAATPPLNSEGKQLFGPYKTVEIRVWHDEPKQAVDLAGGGYKIERAGYPGRRARTKIYRVASGHDNYPDPNGFTSLTDSRMTELIRSMAKRELITEDQFTVLIDDQDDILDGDWQWFGEAMEKRIRDGYDESHLTPRIKREHREMSGSLQKFMKYDTDKAPADLKLFVAKAKDALEERRKLRLNEFQPNEHDKRFELLQTLHPRLQPPITTVADPVEAINLEWEKVKEKYLLIDDLLSSNSWFPQGTKEFEHYFELLVKAGYGEEVPHGDAAFPDDGEDEDVLDAEPLDNAA